MKIAKQKFNAEEVAIVQHDSGQPYFCKHCYKTNCFIPLKDGKFSCVCCKEVSELN